MIIFIKLITLFLFNVISMVTTSSSYLDMYDSQMSDWDSILYGKPICINIPSNMSLCQNINYNQMKMPNLLGHETVEEIVYQSSVWQPLLSINCHKDAQLFLCSMFAPVCVEQAQAIYPCRSLCESVKQSCEGPMLSYKYPWPAIFNCSQFPDDNGLCIPLSNSISTTEPQTTTIATTTLEPITSSSSSTQTTKISFKNPKNKPSKDNLLLQDQTCFGCDEDNLNLEQIVYGYCKSDIVMRARIQTIKISRLELTNLRSKELNMVNKFNKTRSLYLKISKRDRKLIKGAKLIQSIGYVNENLDDEDEYDSKELNVYLMSNMNLKFSGFDANRAFESRDPNLSRSNKKRIRNLADSKKVSFNRKRFINGNHCVCERLKKGARRINTKYLIMANVLKTSNLRLFNRNQRSLNQTESNGIKKREENNQIKLIYLTNVVQWSKARAFIDYLDDESIDKTNMCRNVKRTVNEINKANNDLF